MENIGFGEVFLFFFGDVIKEIVAFITGILTLLAHVLIGCLIVGGIASLIIFIVYKKYNNNNRFRF